MPIGEDRRFGDLWLLNPRIDSPPIILCYPLHIIYTFMKRHFSSILNLMIVLFITFSAEPLWAASDDSNQPKRSHKWLIPVGAGAGFGLGLLIGLRAYDDAINSDQKVWTTAIAGAAIGGVGGWFASHRMDRGSENFVWPAQAVDEKITNSLRAQMAPTMPYIIIHNETTFRRLIWICNYRTKALSSADLRQVSDTQSHLFWLKRELPSL